jgi:ADP-dependent NAD(P)H-hydrate dehydratase / NAD(P)H-hydrate epimerase
MENAGKAVSALILKKYPNMKRILIFCGKGSNGGDGFVIARHLWNAFKEASVVLLSDVHDLKGDALANYQALPHRRMKIFSFSEFIASDLLVKSDLIVDALFGIGLNADVCGEYRQAIELINSSNKPVVAVDIPSGLHADTGTILGAAVKANVTVTIGFMKAGMIIQDGPQQCGEISIIDIGLPRLDTPIGF